MNNVAETLLGQDGISPKPSGWGYGSMEPFCVDSEPQASLSDGDFMMSLPREYQGIPYVYLGHISSNPTLRGRGTGQGRRLVKDVMEIAFSYPVRAITCYVVNPIAMTLLTEEAGDMNSATWVSDDNGIEIIRVRDLLGSSTKQESPRLQTLAEGRSFNLSGAGLRYAGGLGFKTVIALED